MSFSADGANKQAKTKIWHPHTLDLRKKRKIPIVKVHYTDLDPGPSHSLEKSLKD